MAKWMYRLGCGLPLALLLTSCEPPPADTQNQESEQSQPSPVASPAQMRITSAQEAEYLKNSQAAATALKQKLKAELTQSLQSQGTVASIAFCQGVAPAIAQQVATEHQLQIRRVSLKSRNPAAEPDAYEAETLEQWLAALAQDPAAERPAFAAQILAATDTAIESDKSHPPEMVFRYLEPLYIEKGCLQCHGSNLKPEVQQKLTQLYPHDRATGYQEGDLRGAVSVSITIH